MSKSKFVVFSADGDYADITLAKGVKIDGTTVKTLRMREPTVRDQRASDKAEGNNADKETTLFANLCGVLPDDMNDLSARDYNRLQDAYLGFID